jgi:hypothetical protein
MSKKGLDLNLKGGTEYKMDPVIPITNAKDPKNKVAVEVEFGTINMLNGIRNTQAKHVQIIICSFLRGLDSVKGFRSESPRGLSASLSLSKNPFKLKCPKLKKKIVTELVIRDSTGS